MKRTNFNFRDIDTIGEIQTCFSHYFPSLKIKFFLNKKDTQPDNAWVMLSPEVKIGAISPDSRSGYVELNNEMTITELENSINDHFKVHSEISPIIGEMHVLPGQGQSGNLNHRSNESIHGSERTNAGYFNKVPFGC